LNIYALAVISLTKTELSDTSGFSFNIFLLGRYRDGVKNKFHHKRQDKFRRTP